MSELDKYVEASEDDWIDGDSGYSDTDNTLVVAALRYLGLNVTDRGYCVFDASIIPDEAEINSATIYWYDHSYVTKGVDVGHSRIIGIYNGVDYHVVFSSTDDVVPGPQSHELDTADLAYISKTGETEFRFTVAAVAGKNRKWEIRAFDGYSGADEQPRLVIGYTVPRLFRVSGESSKVVEIRGESAIGPTVEASGAGAARVLARGDSVLALIEASGSNGVLISARGEGIKHE